MAGATAAFGSFFLAKLMQVAQARTQDANKLPVFAYVDEANDYLAQNAAVRDIIDKAREQRVSLTTALHDPEIVGAEVQAALRRAAIQAFNGTGERGTWDVRINGGHTATIRVPPFDFSLEPSIPEWEFEDIKKHMRRRFSQQPVPKNESEMSMEPESPVADPMDNPKVAPLRPTVRKPKLTLLPPPDTDQPTED